MFPAAEERIPALTCDEDIFSLAVPLAAALETHQGANAAQGKKSHQGIFFKNRTFRVSATRAKWSGTHQVSGRWWSETVLGIAIDANGNTLSDASGKSYTWDFENRLTQAIVPGTNGGTTTFKYDPFGRRIQKSGPLGTTNYLYDGIDSLNDVDQNGSVLARYTPGVWIDEPLAEFAAATTGYYQADALGTVSSISSPAGTLVNTYTYDSFGKLTTSTGTFVNRFQYTGREFDPETAQYYYRARYYDVNIGRFISEDPIRFKAGTDFYKYVNNSPLNSADPTGYCPPGPLPTPCRCSGSGGAPFVGVCKLQCTCGSSVDDYYFTMSGLKRNCGWAGKTCPATIEGVQITGFGGDKVVLPQKCYGLQ